MRYCHASFLALVIVLPGCSVSEKAPQYEANWSKLKVGMSKEEVIDILGESSSRSIPGISDFMENFITDANLPEPIAQELTNDNFFDNFRYEHWHYGTFDFLENLIFPSDNAYVVYFNKDGQLVSFRESLTCWEKSPYYFKDVSSTIRIGGDYLDSLAERAEGPLSPSLEPPILLYPEDHAVFCHFPREIVFRWRPARGTPREVEYLVQIENTCKGDDEKFGDWTDEPPFFTDRTGKTTMNERFVGAQPGRWRVKTINKTGESKWSDWSYFRFTQ